MTLSTWQFEWFKLLSDLLLEKFVEGLLGTLEQVCGFVESAEKRWKLVE